jgi:lipoprotein NlpD
MFILTVVVVLCALLVQCAPPRTIVRQDRVKPVEEHAVTSSPIDYNPNNERLRYSDADLASLYGLEDREASYKIETPSRSTDIPDEDSLQIKTVKQPAPMDECKKTFGVGAYKVKKGDTLISIARRSGCSVDDVCTLNGIKAGAPIYAGMVLKVPSTGKKEQHAPVKTTEPQARKTDKTAVPRFSWPIPAVVKVSREEINGVKPIGIEITGASGQSVLSAAAGTVKKVGDMRGFGTYIIIAHDDRFVTVYARLKSVNVREGDTVKAGSTIGVPESGCAVHFEIGRSGKPVDPLAYLPKKS